MRAVVLAMTAAGGCRGGRAPSSAAAINPAFKVADSLRLEGRTEQSLPLYRTLRDSFAQAHDTADWWRAQMHVAEALKEEGRHDSARVAYDNLMALAAGNDYRLGWTHYARSSYYDRQGKFDSALADASAALALAQRSKDAKLQAATTHAMGRIHSLTGRYREALDDHTRALVLLRTAYGDTSRNIAVELSELGIDYRHLGRFTDAERVLERALAGERARRNPEGVARVSSNLANVYTNAGDDARALPLMLDALHGAEQIGEVRGQVYEHNDLANLYMRYGNLDAARAHVRAALALNRENFLAYGRVFSLDELGQIDLASGQPRMAVAVLDSARRLADSAGFGRERVTSRAALARAEIAAGDAASALRWGASAVQIADSLGDPEAQAEAREANATVLEKARVSSALGEYQRTIALLESWRGRLALGDLRMGVVEPRMAAFEGAIRILVHNGRAAEAFDIAERARARLLLELMAEHDTGRAQSRREQLRQRLRERFAALDGVRPASRAPIDQEIAALIDSVGEADRDAEAHDPAGAAAFPSPAPFDKIQHDLLAPGRALVAFFWGDSAVYGWWVTSNSVRAVRLGRSDSLASVVDFLRTSIDDPTGRVPWTAAARHAYQALVEPLEPGSAAEVLVVADGPLAYVPIEVLVPQTGGQPWGATRSFVYGPSAGVLHALTVAPTGRGWSRSMLAVGDPQAPTRWWSRLLGSQTNDGWAPLPYSAAEVRQVAGLFDTGDADLLIGSSATVERWRELGPGRYRYLHFAAHAAISDRVAAQSALVLAGGVLDLPAIRRLQLTADLVTLSACETGLGQRIRGEGVLGLPHAFLAAGARGVVVTLWRVTDRSAADFMQEFYRELRAGRSPAAALLAVRRAHLTASGPASLPYHWAPFVLVGGIAGGGH